jgi:hypothetical protein
VAGEGEEHLVEAGLAESEFADGDAGAGESGQRGGRLLVGRRCRRAFRDPGRQRRRVGHGLDWHAEQLAEHPLGIGPLRRVDQPDAQCSRADRQTIYAHFPSREALLDAVVERAAAEVTAAFEAAGLEEAPPAEELIQLLDAGWQAAARYPFLWHLPAVGPEEDASRHGPVLDRLLQVIKRGQESGDFDRRLSPAWRWPPASPWAAPPKTRSKPGG